MDTCQVLREARELISDESNWTSNYLARDKHGYDVAPTSPEACQWCALGAIARVMGVNEYPDTISSQKALKAGLGTLGVEVVDRLAGEATALLGEPPFDTSGAGCVVRLNDRHGHTSVLTAFDRAINNCA